MSTATLTRRPAPSAAHKATAPVEATRTLRVISSSLSLLRLAITDRGHTDTYDLTPLPSDYGLAVTFAKSQGRQRLGETYAVCCGHAGNEEGPDSCECMAFAKIGTCRHVEALDKLVRTGKIG